MSGSHVGSFLGGGSWRRSEPLPLLASVPPQAISAYKSGASKFYKDFFEAMSQGLGACRADLTSHSAMLSSIAECALYVLLQPRPAASSTSGGKSQDDAAVADVVRLATGSIPDRAKRPLSLPRPAVPSPRTA